MPYSARAIFCSKLDLLGNEIVILAAHSFVMLWELRRVDCASRSKRVQRPIEAITYDCNQHTFDLFVGRMFHVSKRSKLRWHEST